MTPHIGNALHPNPLRLRTCECRECNRAIEIGRTSDYCSDDCQRLHEEQICGCFGLESV